MIAVIFEVVPHPDKKDSYLSIAADMRSLVDRIDGFISVERFQSLTNPEKLLSLSFFEDEGDLNEWRQLTKHRAAQKAGRAGLFKDYRLRVAHVLRDYGMTERDEAPDDSRDMHG